MTPPARRQSEGPVRLRGTSVFRRNRYHDGSWAATGFSGGQARSSRGGPRTLCLAGPAAARVVGELGVDAPPQPSQVPPQAGSGPAGPRAGPLTLAGQRPRSAYLAVSPPFRALEPT